MGRWKTKAKSEGFNNLNFLGKEKPAIKNIYDLWEETVSRTRPLARRLDKI
jgi:hypothetical protein